MYVKTRISNEPGLRKSVITRWKSLKDKFMPACLKVFFKKRKWFGQLDVLDVC